jgi:hypothetical protein
MIIAVAVVALALVVTAVAVLFFRPHLLNLLRGATSASEAPLPYMRKDHLLTPGEAAFFRQLLVALQGRFLPAVKVRVADLISVRKGTENWQSHFNRISSKHVDFVLLDPQSLRPLLAIELDDKSHDAANRRERDEFVNDALDAAQMPMLRIKAARSYSPAELWAQIEASTRTTGPTKTSIPAS